MASKTDSTITTESAGTRIRVWRDKETLKWRTACLTHNTEADQSETRLAASAKRSASAKWCVGCKEIVLARLPPLIPCCFRENGKQCDRRSYLKTTNIKDGEFEVCRVHGRILTDKGVTCVPLEGVSPSECSGESLETQLQRAKYLRDREKRRREQRRQRRETRNEPEV